MSGEGRQPATKFATLRKEVGKARPVVKISKKK